MNAASRLRTVAALSLILAGCAGRGAPPPAAAPPPARPAPAPAPVEPAPAEVVAPGDTLRRLRGPVSAPWDTAATSGATRRAHVYPQGESEVGRRLVASLPDPAGGAPAEGPPAAAAPAPAATTAPPPAAPAPGAGCWEAQLLATSDPARAERTRAEASALLGVSVRVVSAGGMLRVRAGGCLDAEAALRLVERARAEGWPEAFRTEASR